MPPFLRIALAVVCGFVAWFVVATVGNLVLRAVLAGYADVERSMSFSVSMMIGRLVLGAVSSIAAGAACAALARHVRSAVWILAVALTLFFIPVHVGLWDRFPLWYHAIFLVSLAPLVLLGARMTTSRRAGVERVPST